jgi:DNA-binding IclR family transcriptional regulator
MSQHTYKPGSEDGPEADGSSSGPRAAPEALPGVTAGGPGATRDWGQSRGIQSIEVGGRLLRALADHGRALSLKELAQAADMAPGKAHPYLVSFGKLGLIDQDSTGRYGLGPLAMELGLISLQQYDPIRLAEPLLVELARATDQSAATALWGNHGPTIVRIEEAPSAVHVRMRPGTVASLRHTATGKAFAAFHARERVLEVIGQATLDAPFEAELARVRAEGVSLSVDGLLRGISAMSAPVFDQHGHMVLALTLIGPTPAFDPDPLGPLAQTLRSYAQWLSRRLGAPLNASASPWRAP